MDGEHRRWCLTGTGHRNGEHGQWAGAGLLEGNGRLGRAELLLGPRTGERKVASWAGGEFWSMAIRKNEKGIFILQIFSKFRTNLNSNEIYNFDDFHSHNKL
jgi:hypothetical protein